MAIRAARAFQALWAASAPLGPASDAVRVSPASCSRRAVPILRAGKDWVAMPRLTSTRRLMASKLQVATATSATMTSAEVMKTL